MKKTIFLSFATAVVLAAFATGAVTHVLAAELETQVAQAKKKPSSVNRFNRLFKGAGKFNLPPDQDGIHDPESPGTLALQPPKEAFDSLPKARSGNRVNWVKALRSGELAPRADRYDENKKMTVLNLNIVRQVKGSMPDVVYPHKQHTEWLDCRNCHPKIFIPKKGANNISMAAILMGQYCGVCHGKVAFPISECRFCHSKNKSPERLKELRKKQAERTKRLNELARTVKTAPKKAPVKREKLKPASKASSGGTSRMDALMKKGAVVYEENCSGCHGVTGEGVPDTFPALKGNKVATGPLGAHVAIVLNGKPDTAMQPWKEDLKPEEIAAVITFERNAWGNDTGDVILAVDIKAALSK